MQRIQSPKWVHGFGRQTEENRDFQEQKSPAQYALTDRKETIAAFLTRGKPSELFSENPDDFKGAQMEHIDFDANEKFFITRQHTNQITHRKLDSFERKNQSLFDLYKKKHSTWMEARDHIVGVCQCEIVRIQKDLDNAKARLKRAESMVDPT